MSDTDKDTKDDYKKPQAPELLVDARFYSDPDFIRFELSGGDVGIYFKLQAYLWSRDYPCLKASDADAVAVYLRVDPQALRDTLAAMADCGFLVPDGDDYVSEDILAQYRRLRKKSTRISESRSRAAKKRWDMQTDANGCKRMQTQANDATYSNSKSISNSKSNSKKSPPGYREGTRNPKGYTHIWLSDSEITALLTTYGRDALEQCFASLEEHIENGKRDYLQKKNHNLTLQNWLKRAKARGEINPPEQQFSREALRKAVEEKYGKN